jgi:S-formylglutathione hydrolase FrmB
LVTAVSPRRRTGTSWAALAALALFAACGGTPAGATTAGAAGASGTPGDGSVDAPASPVAGPAGAGGGSADGGGGSLGAAGAPGGSFGAAGTGGGSLGAAGAPTPPPDASTTSDASGSTDAPASVDAGALPSPLPRGYPTGSAARTEQKTYLGPISHQMIGFNVYLPAGYDSGTLRYPVVYDLHGLTGSQFEDGQWVIPSLEAAMKKALIGPVIVVFPDGLQESYYADSPDGKKPSETRIVRDLVPHVDATYRTIPHRHVRAVTGFSMGGYGAMELATKFPDVFGVGIAYDAALDTWQTLVGRRAAIAAATFGDDEATFDKYSPWANAKANAAALRASSALRLVPGTTYQVFDAAFRDALAALPVPLDYVETTCPHDYGCALGVEGAQSWTFMEAAFERR